ncbi:MAG: hypothetical protein M0R73_11730 [Dehalococcoidia bacterium]|nr:hypothetical protein [Dehalococcoidia bacterium]
MTSPVAGTMTADELLRHVGAVTSASDARALLRRAARVAGVRRDRPMATRDLLLVLEALGAEGGSVQLLAEQLARQALRP